MKTANTKNLEKRFEQILNLLGASKVYDAKHGFTDEGFEAYGKLIEILMELHDMGLINEPIESFEMCFDEILRNL